MSDTAHNTSPRALVTGASSGIGETFARQLAGRGYRITAVARREERLQQLIESLPGAGHRYLVADLSDAAAVTAVGDDMLRERCHLLVNNAGYSNFEPFHSSPLEVQQAMLAVDCTAVVTLSHRFLQQAAEGDALINVSSIVSCLPTPAQPIYSASKAFTASFSECLWETERHRGIYVMGLCPGLTSTEFVSAATGGESDGSTLPASMTQSSDAVVEEALVALERRKQPIIVTGRANRLMVGLMPRLLTRFRLLKTLAVIGDPEKAL